MLYRKQIPVNNSYLNKIRARSRKVAQGTSRGAQGLTINRDARARLRARCARYFSGRARFDMQRGLTHKVARQAFLGAHKVLCGCAWLCTACRWLCAAGYGCVLPQCYCSCCCFCYCFAAVFKFPSPTLPSPTSHPAQGRARCAQGLRKDCARIAQSLASYT